MAFLSSCFFLVTWLNDIYSVCDLHSLRNTCTTELAESSLLAFQNRKKKNNKEEHGK